MPPLFRGKVGSGGALESLSALLIGLGVRRGRAIARGGGTDHGQNVVKKSNNEGENPGQSMKTCMKAPLTWTHFQWKARDKEGSKKGMGGKKKKHTLGFLGLEESLCWVGVTLQGFQLVKGRREPKQTCERRKQLIIYSPIVWGVFLNCGAGRNKWTRPKTP